MNISHLSHDAGCIRCKCGREFEANRRTLSDPYQLTLEKERIAAKHQCRTKSPKPQQPKKPERPENPWPRAYYAPTTAGQLAHYYSQAMRRHSFAAR